MQPLLLPGAMALGLHLLLLCLLRPRLIHAVEEAAAWSRGVAVVQGVNYAFPALSPDGSTVLVGTDAEGEEGSISALSASDGTVKWGVKVAKPVTSAPVISDDSRTVFVGSRDGKVSDTSQHFQRRGILPYQGIWVCMLSTLLGGIMPCTTPTPPPPRPTQPLSPLRLTVPCLLSCMQVYALSSATGAVLWAYQTGSMITSSPVLSLDGKVPGHRVLYDQIKSLSVYTSRLKISLY